MTSASLMAARNPGSAIDGWTDGLRPEAAGRPGDSPVGGSGFDIGLSSPSEVRPGAPAGEGWADRSGRPSSTSRSALGTAGVRDSGRRSGFLPDLALRLLGIVLVSPWPN